MYAVEKLSSYITRGVYTVSGPFHPFGGAIDIIVVQQQDGSFKSSPWYVRFGKFQGVLKTREKVVKIAVNDVEAGFSMYLDSKGEAFFLKDSDGSEGDFILSPLTSGDETDAKTKIGRPRKAKSLDVESSWEEPVNHVEIGNDKIVTRTNSRRSMLLGMVFGGKSTKEDSGSASAERASLLERAEFAADLLEVKWSTNLTSTGPERGDNSRGNPSESIETNLSSVDQEQILQTPLLPDGFTRDENLISHGKGVDDNDERSNSRTNHSEEVRDYDSPCIRIDDDVGKIYLSQAGNLANSTELTSDQANIESVFSNPIVDAQNFGLNINNTLNDPEGNGDICMSKMLTEEHFQGDIANQSKIVSESLAVQTKEIHIQNHGSAACFNDVAQSVDRRHDDPAFAISTFENGENEMKSFSYTEAIETSTTTSDVPSNEVTEYINHPSNERRRFTTNAEVICGQSEMISELGLPSELGGLACQASKNSCEIESLGISKVENHFSSISFLPNRQMLSSESDIIGCESWMKGSAEEREASTEHTVPFRNNSQIGEGETEELNSFSKSASTNSSYSVGFAESQNKEVVNLKSSASGVNVNQENNVDCRPEEMVESRFSLSESLEDIQFPFTDNESLGANVSGRELLDNDTVIENDKIFTTEGDMKEYKIKDLADTQSPKSISDVLRSHSSPINIPAYRKNPEGNELSARSLPIFRCSLSELEESYLHPLSSSLDAKSDICQTDVLKKEHASSLKPELETESNQESSKLALDSTDKDAAAESSGEEKISTNSIIELSLSKHLLFKGMGAEAARRASDAEQEQIVEPQGMIPVVRDGMNLKKVDTSSSISSPEGSWRLWPFGLRRTRTIDTVQSPRGNATKKDEDHALKVIGNSNRQSGVPRADSSRNVPLLTPTSEELASLNLKEGRNVVTFTFSTPMLGLQQVDARIYLWKWNTRIVISDVDGTITKSDVLGQFMPLVGIDWSQTGVAHLFSGIKENGYQLLFLSARAISQAHLTRQFLFNLKQDGKALPDGPVVISPDGLFPSLYREVIRRAPHEFKISCLEAIKALFPPDCNPFYAGFGNRDTDEISYLKVGIPLGKIFIINPKGQVAFNRRIDTKSYSKLHELVNAIFPPMTSDEQEDFNTWTFWKLPLPDINI